MAFAVGCVTARVGGAEEGYRGGPHCRGQMQRTGICADKYRAAPHTRGKVLIRLGERDGKMTLGGRHAEGPQQLDELLHHGHIRIDARPMAIGQYGAQRLPAALTWKAYTDGRAAEVCQERALQEPLEIDAEIETGPPEVPAHIPRMVQPHPPV